MTYKGSCHCGQIAFEVEGELKEVMACNCSICSRKGSLLWFVPRDQFHLLTAEDRVSTYTFNKHFIKHRFCPKCGIHPFSEASDKSAPTKKDFFRALACTRLIGARSLAQLDAPTSARNAHTASRRILLRVIDSPAPKNGQSRIAC